VCCLLLDHLAQHQRVVLRLLGNGAQEVTQLQAARRQEAQSATQVLIAIEWHSKSHPAAGQRASGLASRHETPTDAT
jgi:hypothetical protein